MQDYNDFLTATNKIFDYVEKMKAGWNSQDNMGYIEKIEELKPAVTGLADEFKKPAAPVPDEEEMAAEEESKTEQAPPPNEQAVPPMQNDAVVSPEAMQTHGGPEILQSTMPQQVVAQAQVQAAQSIALPTISLPQNVTQAAQPVKPAPIAKLETTSIPTLDGGTE